MALHKAMANLSVTLDQAAVKVAKRAHDDAAAEWCEHALWCSDGCSILAGARCPEGERLLVSENAAWDGYHRARNGGTS